MQALVIPKTSRSRLTVTERSMGGRKAMNTRLVKSNRTAIRALDKGSKIETCHSHDGVVHGKGSKPTITKSMTMLGTVQIAAETTKMGLIMNRRGVISASRERGQRNASSSQRLVKNRG